MKKARKKYNQEFKDDAVLTYLNGDQSQTELAQDLGINVNLIGRWVKEHKKTEEKKRYPNESAQQKINWLEKDNARLRQHNEILKKSIGIISHV